MSCVWDGTRFYKESVWRLLSLGHQAAIEATVDAINILIYSRMVVNDDESVPDVYYYMIQGAIDHLSSPAKGLNSY